MSKRILFAILTGVLILPPRLAHSELRVNLSIKPGADVAVYPVTTGVPFAKGTVKRMAEAYKLTGDERYREQAIRILEQEVYPYAHTADNGFGPALADGVWWVEDEDAGGWRNQAWMVDQMGDALYSAYTILDDGPVKERTRKTLLDVADWVIDYAWKPEPGGLAVQYTKTKEGICQLFPFLYSAASCMIQSHRSPDCLSCDARSVSARKPCSMSFSTAPFTCSMKSCFEA